MSSLFGLQLIKNHDFSVSYLIMAWWQLAKWNMIDSE